MKKNTKTTAYVSAESYGLIQGSVSMDINKYLAILAKNDGSDLYLSIGAPPSGKFHGKLRPLGDAPLKSAETKDIAYAMMDQEQRNEFEHELEMNLAYNLTGVGRFRVNIFKQQNEISLVARYIVTDIPNLDALGLPPIFKDIVMSARGLVLIVGATGSGKSTSLAALIDHRNSNSSGHIITIEDPVEFIHKHNKCIINQREVGVDTRSFHKALKNTLRQAPDVISIGEIRDRETMEHAIAFAETGHLCISTLHANNANQALDRIINFFPEERRNQVLMDLSLNLRAFISQRLVTTLDGKRTAAIEILLGTPAVSELIQRGEIDGIKEIMQRSENLGMQTFDMALFDLFERGVITMEEALKNADSANNLRLRIKLHIQGSSISERAGTQSVSSSVKVMPASVTEPENVSLSLEKIAEEGEDDGDFQS